MEERFGNESSIVFTMLNSKGIQGEVYCPQPSFLRTKAILPLLRELGNMAEEVNPLTYSVDFDFILEEALNAISKRRYEAPKIESAYKAWITEFMSMAKVFDLATGDDIEISSFLEKESDKRDFQAWLTFFFILSRYILREGIGEKEKMQYYTHLEYEDFKEAFLKYLEELELAQQKMD